MTHGGPGWRSNGVVLGSGPLGLWVAVDGEEVLGGGPREGRG